MAESHEPMSAETWAESLTDGALACHELGHNWRPRDVTHDPVARCYERVMLCHRCRTERRQLLTEYGHVLQNRYTYRDGYLAHGVEFTKGGGRDVYRAESVARWLTKKGT